MENRISPFALSSEETYRAYASRLGLPVEYVRNYFLDVKSLEGKLPDGTFTSPVDSEDEDLFEGFTDPIVFDGYKLAIEGQMKEDMSRYPLSQKTALEDLARTRELAISRILQLLLPQFEPKCLPIEAVMNVQSTPMGGQPPKGRRHP
jgi:hypothetical protein